MIWLYLFVAYFVVGLFVGLYFHREAVKNYSGAEIEMAIVTGLLWLPLAILWLSIQFYYKVVEKL